MSGGGGGGGASGGDMSGGGAGGGGAAGGGGVRGLGGQMPGTGGGAGGADGADCGASLPGGVGGMEGSGECAGGVGQVPGETEAERKARLEGELDKSVGGFDEVLAEEQREISTVGRDTEGFGGGGGAGGRGGVGLGKQATGGIEGTGEVARAESAGAGSTPSIDSMSEEEIAKRTPEDIPDLVSEDIVAKQLKEAALAENDPVLRERLWEEYRNYNNL
jgi:hypothetical protein